MVSGMVSRTERYNSLQFLAAILEIILFFETFLEGFVSSLNNQNNSKIR